MGPARAGSRDRTGLKCPACHRRGRFVLDQPALQPGRDATTRQGKHHACTARVGDAPPDTSSTPALALLAARTSARLAISEAVQTEHVEVLSQPKFAKAISAAQRDAFLSSLMANAATLEPAARVHDCRDPDDMHLELALAAGAEAIVSGDAHLWSFPLARHPNPDSPGLPPCFGGARKHGPSRPKQTG